jgi:hypothetical protein
VRLLILQPHDEKFEITRSLYVREIQKLKLSMGISISLISYKRTVKLIVLFLPLNGCISTE